MSGFKIKEFSGLIPRKSESDLPPTCATISRNCDLAYGELRNTRGGFQIGTMTNSPQSIFTEDGLTFYTWDSDVFAVRSPMVNDSYNRMYFTQGGELRVANRTGTRTNGGPPGTSYKVGVPRPTVSPSLSTPAHVTDAKQATWAYVYTYVNVYKEEGPPSDPVSITGDVAAAVTVTATKDTATDYVPIKQIRVYRTPTSATIPAYFYVGTIEVEALANGATATFVDNVDESMVAEQIASTNFYAPPTGLSGVITLPNGILMAWSGNDIYFSDPYKPWSWPPAYAKATPNMIVGAIAHGSGAFVTTLGSPFMVYGVAPQAMALTKINLEQAGVSRWAIAVVNGQVVYASPDGIVTLSGATGTLDLGARFFTRDVWRAAYAAGFSTMRFSVWDGRLIVFSSTGAFTPFMIRFDEAMGTLTELPTMVAKCAFISPLSDQCYFANATGIFQFNGGVELDATWQSRELVVARPENYGFAQAVVDGTWTISFYADGVLRHEEAVTTGVRNFRLPSGFKSDRWKVKITGKGRFRELRVGTTALSLATV